GKVKVAARPAGRRAARPRAAPRSRERPVAPQLVVLLALLGIAQHVVRFVDLLEALRRLRLVGVAVGMVLLGEPAKRLLDLVGGRRLRNTQDLIVVLLAGHLRSVSRPTPVPPQHHHSRRPDQGTAHPPAAARDRPVPSPTPRFAL